MSRIASSMLNGSGNVKVEGPYSGAVYAQNLRGDRRDTSGNPIKSRWVPVYMAAVPKLMTYNVDTKKLSRLCGRT